jgi:hypothetical protein
MEVAILRGRFVEIDRRIKDLREAQALLSKLMRESLDHLLDESFQVSKILADAEHREATAGDAS